jgi:putative Holliday junction resolvase
MSKILALDYGTKNIGVAISDSLQVLAFARNTIFNITEEQVIKELGELCRQENIDTVILGLPLRLNGQNSFQTDKVVRFGEKLQQSLGIKIEYIDERLSSVQSKKIIHYFFKDKKDCAKTKNMIEAKLILELFLEKIANEFDK